MDIIKKMIKEKEELYFKSDNDFDKNKYAEEIIKLLNIIINIHQEYIYNKE